MKRGDQGVFTLEVSNWMPGPNPERRRLSFGLELSRVHAQTGEVPLDLPFSALGASRCSSGLRGALENPAPCLPGPQVEMDEKG